jgi:hypothetical protein
LVLIPPDVQPLSEPVSFSRDCAAVLVPQGGA